MRTMPPREAKPMLVLYSRMGSLAATALRNVTYWAFVTSVVAMR